MLVHRLAVGTLCCAFLLIGCTAGRISETTPQSGAGQVPALAEQLPDLAQLSAAASPGRHVSYQDQTARLGDEFLLTSPSGASVVAGNDLLLLQGTGPLGWAIYEFGIDDSAVTLDEIAVHAQVPADTYYFAISNYDLDAWEIVSATTGAAGLQTLSESTVRDADAYQFHETSYIAVFAYGDQQLVIDSVSLKMNIKPSGPSNLRATGTTPGTEQLDAVVLKWNSAVGSEGYWIDYCLVEEPQQLDFQFLAQGGSATEEFSHTVDNPPGQGAEYGVRYLYRVRSMFQGEPSQIGGPMVEGVRAIPAPELFEASDQLDPQWVHLEWTPVEGATGYAIRADDPENGPVAITTDSFTAWNTEDGAEHTFYVTTGCSEGPSVTRTETRGSMANWFGATLTNSGEQLTYTNVETALGAPQILAISAGSVLYSSTVDTSGLLPVPSPLAPVYNGKPDLLRWQPGIAAQAGLLWMCTHHIIAGDTPDELLIGYSSDPTPDSEDDWTIYPVYSAGVSSERLCLVSNTSRLFLLFRTDSDNGNIMYFGQSTFSPSDPSGWAIGNFRADDSDFCEVYDMAAMGATVGACYEEGGILTFAWTNTVDPLPEDWTRTELTSTGQIRAVSLESRGEFPAIAYVHKNGATTELRYAVANVLQPTQNTDWDDELVAVLTSSAYAIDLCFWQDLVPLIAYHDEDSDQIMVTSRMELLPGISTPSWPAYSVGGSAEVNWPDSGLDLAVQNGRPVLVHSRLENDANLIQVLHLPPPEV